MTLVVVGALPIDGDEVRREVARDGGFYIGACSAFDLYTQWHLQAKTQARVSW